MLVVFWASWASPVKNDLPDLISIYEKYHRSGFEVIGINVDNDRADLDAFVKQHKLTWPQIFETGGMDGRLAVDYGIISLPTMFLVDAQGKVVNRNLRIAELEKQLEKIYCRPSSRALRTAVIEPHRHAVARGLEKSRIPDSRRQPPPEIWNLVFWNPELVEGPSLHLISTGRLSQRLRVP